MNAPRPRWIGWILVLGIVALTVFYADAIRTRFLNDDYLFLEQARTVDLGSSLVQPDPLGNYWRPLSRQLYFAALTPIADGNPLVFHLVNFALFVAGLALLADLLLAFAPWPGVLAGLVTFALLPFQRVNLTWVSCSQDLLALVGTLGAFACYRRGRDRLAALLYLLAVLSKESALPLPIALAAWSRLMDRESWRGIARRLAPFALGAAAWLSATVILHMTTRFAAPLSFHPLNFVAGYAHLIQSLVGLDNPRMLTGRFTLIYDPISIVLMAAIALALRRSRVPAPDPEAAADPPRPAPRRAGIAFAAIWLAAFGLVTGPVAASWSAYYYTLAAAGAALLVAIAASRIGATGWLALVTALFVVHGANRGTPAFAVRNDPWVWTSHLGSFYFERAARITGDLSRQLVALEPHPPADTRFFFSTLPSSAGFQMGNGALIRALYRAPQMQSHFYSQFSDSTAGWHPCRFFYWDGQSLAPLYDATHGDPFFQVGTDLLLFDRPAGAAHAFRRGLTDARGGFDHLYWLGWAEMFRGRRAEAEGAWTEAGMHEDSLVWYANMRVARQSLNDRGDTLEARRALARALVAGPGRPEAHAVLGELLLSGHAKYGLLELKVACWLKPNDWYARRLLIIGLAGQRLDDAARRELAIYRREVPEWASDSALAAVVKELDQRRSSASVVEY